MSTDPTRDDAFRDDAFRDWDAAYLLGALSPADRRAYEQHLRGCPDCREALGEFVAIPGLLAHLPKEDALGLLETEQRAEESAPPALLPRLARATDAVRRRTRFRIAGLVLAAAGVSAAAAVALPLVVGAPPTVVENTVALAAAPGVPVEASVRFVPEQWGTRIEMDCSWGDGGQEDAGQEPAGGTTPADSSSVGPASVGYVMYVTDTAGSSEAIGSWTSTPGSTVEPSLSTGLPLAEIASVEVRLQGSDQVVLTGSP
ncbi:zf-HC2 domain-containing protein [Rathayibacter sp. VKM Ac-2856]|uniref:anti-sigma factor family protein n=1 Tax=unclassified Rathayibacter TaxID=2609250 RepID=UPI001565057C|nr:zf-HC2 domain-containing protein [Rathayibacter sp. VKM Ac-2858]NQX19415.1 zf-HC2 domain-containing protein [Rathayibacter sp. VKM Ac-2856]